MDGDVQGSNILIQQGLHMTESGQFIFEELKSVADKRKASLPPEYIPILTEHRTRGVKKNLDALVILNLFCLHRWKEYL